MSNTQEPNETAEPTDEAPDPAWQAFYDQVNAAWKEMDAYFGWSAGGDDDDEGASDAEGEDGEEDADASGEEAAGEVGLNSIDSPLNPAIKHSAAFFELYLARRPGDLANEAARTAFSMYFNCPDSLQRAEAGVSQIGDDLDALAVVAPTYVSLCRLKRDEAAGDALAEQLLEKLGSDTRRSGLLIEMADNWKWNGLYDKMRPACERVIAMNADEHDVKRAKALIYEIENLNVGQPAPAFEATDIDGNPISLAGLRGKAVLIDFWATWCGPCRGEFPHLRRVNEKFASDRFTLLSISLDENCDEARAMIAKEKMAWNHVCEGQWSGSRIAEMYNVMGIPATFLIGPDGKIAAKDLRHQGLDKGIAEVLGLGEPPAA
jgi:peroxiredoxin